MAIERPDSTSAADDTSVWNAWYVIGVPDEIRRSGRTATRLLGHKLQLRNDGATLRVLSAGSELPVIVHLGYAWTTLGDPAGPPQPLPEYDEPDRLVMNVWSTPLRCSGLRIVDNVIDNAHFAFVHPGILGDEDHLQNPPYETSVDADGVLWSRDHRTWLPLTNSWAVYSYRIIDPYSVILYIHRACEAGQTERFDCVGIFAQPIDEESFIAHKLVVWVREDWIEENRFRADQQYLAAQDKYVLERHTPRKLPLWPDDERSVSTDSASLAYRTWLRDRGVRYGAINRGADA